MKTYGDAKFINCPGITSDGIAGHSMRDFCGTCAPFWERVPLCPEHKYKLTETGYCRTCKKHYALEDSKSQEKLFHAPLFPERDE